MKYRGINLKKIRDIATIHTGYTFRSRIDEDIKGNYSIIQVKDFDEDDNLTEASLLKTTLDSINEKFLAQSGDILFRSRGVYTRASLIHQNIANNTVISAPLMIIRINRNDILPAYVQLVINHSTSQRYFDKAAQGSSVRMIDKEALENLEIPFVSLERQKHIVELNRLIKNEKKLMSDITQKRQTLLEGVFQKEKS